jgi:hypothetical protein
MQEKLSDKKISTNLKYAKPDGSVYLVPDPSNRSKMSFIGTTSEYLAIFGFGIQGRYVWEVTVTKVASTGASIGGDTW